MKRPAAGLILFLAAASPGVAGDFEYNTPAGSQMAEAMWDMMDWMRGENGGPFSFSTDGFPGMNPGGMNPGGMSPGMGNFGWPMWGMSGMPSYMDGMPMMDNFSDVYEASPWARLPDQFERFQEPGGWASGQLPRQAAPAWERGARPRAGQSVSRLDGIWRGASGETFMIEGDRFRLADAAGDYLDGQIQIRGNRLSTFLPITGQTRHYRYVKVGSMLMLRDESDQTLVFERVYR